MTLPAKINKCRKIRYYPFFWGVFSIWQSPEMFHWKYLISEFSETSKYCIHDEEIYTCSWFQMSMVWFSIELFVELKFVLFTIYIIWKIKDVTQIQIWYNFIGLSNREPITVTLIVLYWVYFLFVTSELVLILPKMSFSRTTEFLSVGPNGQLFEFSPKKYFYCNI